MLNIGLIREGKIPTDRRVSLSPKQCRLLIQRYPQQVNIFVQPSTVRCFHDEEYIEAGIELREDLSNCDILLGIKEVPVNMLIPHKTYFFFSHTIKKQTHNRKLLKAIIEKNIKLIDYETLVDDKGERLIAFGWYAGLVGAYNALWMYGKKYKLFEMKRAFQCFDKFEMFDELKKIKLPPVKIALTGGGRVANGAIELLDKAVIKKVSVKDYLQINDFHEAVYTQLRSSDYHAHQKGKAFDSEEFYQYPSHFVSTFSQYYPITDLLIACAYWHPEAPLLFTKEEMRKKNFRIKSVADITCDVDGSIPCTQQSTDILEPTFDYNPISEQVESAMSNSSNITVMAIDNLPTELPRDASAHFGAVLMENILPHLFEGDKEGVIQRATIVENKQLTHNFAYLQDYVEDKEYIQIA
ncbi:MAG: NAD(P)-dependent oxidoreductase [Thermoflexibacter sp.]|jgi:alanine dehydrogenase|nr:NAD(P)-dependent oxidoreductase [Thermoflexibacter sp.]